MKAKLLLIIIGVGLIALVNTYAQNLNIGLSAGYDNVNIHVIPELSSLVKQPYGHRNSFNINCSISYRSRGIFGFSVEPGFIQKGASISKSRLEFNDLQLPLLADVYVLHKFCLSIGPEFSYMISAKIVNPIPPYTDDLSHRYNKFELSGLIGVNYMITKDIGIRISYNHGLTNIDKLPVYGDKWEVVRWVNLYNQYMQVKLCIRIQTIEF